MKKKVLSFFKKKKPKKNPLFLFLGIAVFLVILYLLRGQFIVALVNNRPIWRRTFVKKLEQQAGKQVLDSLVVETLIFQEAEKKKVSISDDEINQEIEEIKNNLANQGQNLDQLLVAQGISQEEFKSQIKIQKVVEAIVGKNISVSNEEIEEFFEKNKEFFPEEQSQEEIEASIREQLEQGKLNETIQEWLNSLRDKAKIITFP